MDNHLYKFFIIFILVLLLSILTLILFRMAPFNPSSDIEVLKLSANRMEIVTFKVAENGSFDERIRKSISDPDEIHVFLKIFKLKKRNLGTLFPYRIPTFGTDKPHFYFYKGSELLSKIVIFDCVVRFSDWNESCFELTKGSCKKLNNYIDSLKYEREH